VVSSRTTADVRGYATFLIDRGKLKAIDGDKRKRKLGKEAKSKKVSDIEKRRQKVRRICILSSKWFKDKPVIDRSEGKGS